MQAFIIFSEIGAVNNFTSKTVYVSMFLSIYYIILQICFSILIVQK